MKTTVATLTLILLALGSGLSAQQTPASMVAAYDALADTILSLRRVEADFVRSLLDGHRHAAQARARGGDWEAAAAEIALFANEGDNAVGGVRKRLLEGGHHFNAEGEEKGLFEPGYVIVNRDAKRRLLEISATLRRAGDDAARQAAMTSFSETAEEVLSKK